MGKGKNEGGKKNQNGSNKEKEAKTTLEDGKKEEPKITEVVLKVYMHCEACKTKVLKCLKAFNGVEDVKADVEDNKVVINGKDLNPVEMLEGIRKKYSKNVELISPIPKPAADSNKHKKDEPKKEKEIEVKTVELKIQMHCEGCERDIKKCIGNMEGVLRVEANKESSIVTVKGVVDPPKLVEAIKSKMGKAVEIVKKKEEATKVQTQDKSKNKKESQPKDQNKTDFVFKYPPQHYSPCDIFSDENVFSCSIM